MRVLGLDYGEKRIGVAWSDLLGLTAQAQPYVLNTSHLLMDLTQIIEEQAVKEIVVGLPVRMDGQDSLMTEKTRHFATQLETVTGLPVFFQDERLSSQAVERHLISMDVRRKDRKKQIDSQAAAFILQGFLDRRQNTLSHKKAAL